MQTGGIWDQTFWQVDNPLYLLSHPHKKKNRRKIKDKNVIYLIATISIFPHQNNNKSVHPSLLTIFSGLKIQVFVRYKKSCKTLVLLKTFKYCGCEIVVLKY